MSKRTALIVVTHLLGVGHLVRAAAIARALSDGGWRAIVASGGAPVKNIELAGCEFEQLPPLHCRDVDFRTLLRADGEIAGDAEFAARRAALIALFDRARPDALITELFPFGRRQLAKEFDALLEHAIATEKRPAVLCSVRDVLHAPSKPEKVIAAERRLGRFYDAILFHGDDAIAPLSASWSTTKAVMRRVRATGYVRDGAKAQAVADAVAPASDVIVSGGGSGVGLDLYRASVAAARLTPKRAWRILAGHGLPESDFQALVADAPANALVERARPDFPALLARTELSVSQAGYNTVLDLAAAGARAILVPFADGAELEQTVRAACLAERGLARVINKRHLSGETLAREVEHAIERPKPDWSAFRLNGAERCAAQIADIADRAADRARAWRRLRATLADLRVANKRVAVWLRDDDAIAMTDQLRAFLERLTRLRIPAALAVIPARLSPDFEAALAPFADVDLLVHGWAHVNHAEVGAKSSEFPINRADEESACDLREGLARVSALAPRRSRPIFVPPWNRAAPNLPTILPALGYRGASGSHRGRLPLTQDAFLVRNIHWDPIAWRAGGGLLDEAFLLDRMTELLASELDASEPLEPIGVLTHHLIHDGWVDRFLDELLATLSESGVVRFLDAAEVFAVKQPA